MKEYAHYHRVLAALAHSQEDGHIPAATTQFLAHCNQMGLKPPKDAAAFVTYWGEEWAQHQSVEGHGSNSGRHRLLSADDVQLVLNKMLQWRADGRTEPYGSIAELKQECPEVRELLEGKGVSNSTVARRLHEACPALKYAKIYPKPKYCQRQLDDRYYTAAGHLEVATDTPKTLERVIWIDAKTMYMKVEARRAWVLTTAEDTFETTLPGSMKNSMKLKYYIAVNYRLGALMLVFYTGTTDMPADRDPSKVYLVSSANVELRGGATEPVLHSSLNGCAPVLLAVMLRGRCLRHQPHHAVTCLLSCNCQCIVPAGPVSQAGIVIVSLRVELAAVLLPLNFNQNPSRV